MGCRSFSVHGRTDRAVNALTHGGSHHEDDGEKVERRMVLVSRVGDLSFDGLED